MRVADCAHREGVAIACPYAERARVAGEERFYDAIALVDATGTLLKNYRKTHLCNRRVAGQLQWKGRPVSGALWPVAGIWFEPPWTRPLPN
jgi:predicted amidohydrolase